MNSSGNTLVRCPNCGAQFATRLEQLFDAGRDPSAKARLLQGQFNVAVCPSCNTQTRIGTPIIYHDPAKQLLLSYVPVELALSAQQKEQFTGSALRAIERSLPDNAPRGYLLHLREVLSLQGLIDAILEADGITRDLVESQSAQVTLLQNLIQTPPDQRPAAIQAVDDQIDFALIELLLAMADSAAAGGQNDLAQALAILHDDLMRESSFGKESRARMKVLEDTANELNKLGEKLTPAVLLDLVIAAAADETRLSALITLARPLVDYNFFLKLTERIDAAEEPEKTRLTTLRESITTLIEEIEAVARERAGQVNAVLQMLLTAPDLDAAVQQVLSAIDDTFMVLLAQNYEAAQKAGRQDVADRLRQIGDAITRAMQASAPPEIRFINQLLSAPDDNTALGIIRQNSANFPAEMSELMENVAGQLQSAGRTEQAEKLLRFKDMFRRERAKNLFG